MAEAQQVTRCRLCAGALGPAVLSLGDQPISNRLPPAEAAPEAVPAYPLAVALCGVCGLAQLTHHLPAEAHFHADYAYRSGASSTWVAHCRDYAAALMGEGGLGPGDLAVELGSNDGTLLRALAERGAAVLGVEPSANVARLAEEAGVPTLVRFFDAGAAAAIRAEHGPARAVIGNNVLAHVPDTAGFLAAARDLLAPDGVLCLEFPHVVHILERRYFDTIYHEHYCYLGLGPLARWAERNAMRIAAVEPQPTHGGSLRLYLRHGAAAPPSEISAMIEAERSASAPERWRALADWLEGWRAELGALIAAERAAGRRIAGYAAASKASVLCNVLGLTGAEISYCCDASPLKQGRQIPGTGIPILDPETLARCPPDTVLVFAWNIYPECRAVIADLVDGPVDILRPLPELAREVLAERAAR